MTKRKPQEVAPQYSKDEAYEKFIESFNRHLVPFEEDQYLDLEETLPSVHVIGVPRSGTTLLTQLICSYLDVGYVNNLIARFWKAPVTGIRISRNLLGKNYESTFTSDFGKTSEIQEPHEFGYFWADLLQYEDFSEKTCEEAEKIDWNRVASIIKNIIHAFGKSVVFKSFLLGWHAALMQQKLKKTCFVWIRRSPVDNALSLLDTRKKYFGSVERWGSLKPLSYEKLKDLSPHEQVAGQVYYLEQAYHRQMEQLPESNYLVLRYEELCSNPSAALKAIRDLINRNGGETRFLRHQVSRQQSSRRRSNETDDYNKVQKAIQTFYS